MRWVLLAALVLVGCEQSPSAPLVEQGPPSLRLAPVEWFSRKPPLNPAKPAAKPAPKPEAPSQAISEPATLPEAVDELERINERLQELRRLLNAPPS